MRISDWSSDVCSSDLRASAAGELPADIDCRALAAFVITHCCGMALRAKAGVSPEMLTGEIDFVLRALPSSPAKAVRAPCARGLFGDDCEPPRSVFEFRDSG